MDIGVRDEGEVTVVQPVGDIDGRTAPDFQAKLLPVIGKGAKILIDLGKVDFLSSAGLRVLLLLYREATGKGASTVIIGMNDEVRNSMSATGFLQYFTTRETLAEGLEALR